MKTFRIAICNTNNAIIAHINTDETRMESYQHALNELGFDVLQIKQYANCVDGLPTGTEFLNTLRN